MRNSTSFQVNAYSGAVHPLVHRHPITGRKADLEHRRLINPELQKLKGVTVTKIGKVKKIGKRMITNAQDNEMIFQNLGGEDLILQERSTAGEIIWTSQNRLHEAEIGALSRSCFSTWAKLVLWSPGVLPKWPMFFHPLIKQLRNTKGPPYPDLDGMVPRKFENMMNKNKYHPPTGPKNGRVLAHMFIFFERDEVQFIPKKQLWSDDLVPGTRSGAAKGLPHFDTLGGDRVRVSDEEIFRYISGKTYLPSVCPVYITIMISIHPLWLSLLKVNRSKIFHCFSILWLESLANFEHRFFFVRWVD